MALTQPGGEGGEVWGARLRRAAVATQDLEQPAAGGREGRDGGFLSDTKQEN